MCFLRRDLAEFPGEKIVEYADEFIPASRDFEKKKQSGNVAGSCDQKIDSQLSDYLYLNEVHCPRNNFYLSFSISVLIIKNKYEK